MLNKDTDIRKMHYQGSEEKMSEYADRERVADHPFFPFKVKEKIAMKDIKQSRHFGYKPVLFLVDGLLAILGFCLGAWLAGYPFDFRDNLFKLIQLIVFALISASFFLNYYLYSYHLIYSPKNHFVRLAKSFVWSLLTIMSIIFIYTWPQFLKSMFFVPALFLLAIVILLLSRVLFAKLINIIRMLGISFLATGFFSVMNPEAVPDIIANEGSVIAVGFAVTVVLIAILRLVVVHVIFNHVLRRRFRRQIIFVGADADAERITNHVIKINAPFWVGGSVGSKPGQVLRTQIPKKSLGTINDLPDIVHKNRIDEVIITDETIGKPLLITLIEFCTSAGITVWFPPKLMPIIDIKIYIDSFCGIPMIRLNTRKGAWLINKIKHTLDAILTLPLFILLLPVFAVIAFAIKYESKGPVFYKARVVGKGEKLFSMYKFRSMVADSDPEIHKNYVTKLIKGEIGNKEASGQTLKITDDPRVTRVGRILRNLSLDELPQVINVIKGEMSLVGPRPCLPYEYDVYADWHKKRTLVRPGITGLWQVAGRSAVVFEDMILLDLYYIFNRNLSIDFSILFETVFVVLQKKGAY